MVDEKKKKAGQARWNGVEPSEQKALASKAAHARWKNKDVLVAQHTGVVRIGTYEFNCAVLSDGRRILSERSLSDALGHVRTGEDYKRRREEAETGQLSLPVVVAPTVRQFLSDEAVEKLSKPIRYQNKEGWGIPAFGIEAVLLADVCEAFVLAREAGALRPDQQPKADAAMRLLRGLARTAIVALIDEATGYQIVRDRDELQKLLEKYVSEEFRPWSAVFPDEFYVHLFRLRNLTTDDVRKRPQYFGHLTNDIVYDRLIPGVRAKLKEVNPANDKGRRARRHTQHLSQSIGETHLRQHLAGVVMLMKASSNYDEFKKALDKAAPKLTEHDITPVPTKAEAS